MWGHHPPVILGELRKEADGAHDDREGPQAFAPLHGCVAEHAHARRRRPLEAPLIAGSDQEGDRMRLRKIAYALASLAALAMAVGAGWRPF